MTSVDTLAADYRTITEACGLLDRSERGKLALSGARGRRPSSRARSATMWRRCVSGSGCYAAFLTPKGKMLGDLRILAAERRAAA